MFLHRYSSILHLGVSQFEFVLGKAVPKMDMKQVNPPLAFLYSILYISFVTVIIVNLFIAILNSSLKAIKDPGGGTLEISGWGCAAGTLEPLTYTRASSGEFCHPILE